MGEKDTAARRRWIADALAEFGDALTRYTARLLGDGDRARDVVQEAFVRLCRQDPDNLDGRVGPWLFTVCRNRALDIRRHEGRVEIQGGTALAAAASGDPSPPAAAMNAEQGRRLLALLDTLSERQQEIVRLRFGQGFSYRQIAEVTGLTVGNVGFQIHTAVKSLREKMTENER